MKPTSIPRVSLTKSVLTRFTTLLHPPLPISPLESRKFLSLIKDSFRTQLNAAASPVAPTETHLRSVLSTAPFLGGEDSRKHFQKFLDDPIRVFQEQVVAGGADMQLAALCLTKYAKIMQAKAKAKASEAMAGKSAYSAAPEATINGERKQEERLSAVTIVFESLRHAGLGAPKTILMNEDLLKAVTMALVAEGREDVIIRWARSTREEIPEPVRRKMVGFGVYEVLRKDGWDHAAGLFRQILAGTRASERKFSCSKFSNTGLKLCGWGMSSGFSETPSYKKLVKSAAIWATHWEMEARVNLQYAKRTEVGVKFFRYLATGTREDFWENQGPSWYRHISKLALDLVNECLVQGQVIEAQMIAEVAKRRFGGETPELELEVGVHPGRSRHRAGEDGAQRTENSESAHGLQELQGILNGLG